MNFKEINERLKTQDGRSTAYPIYIVYDWERIPTSNEYSDNSMFVDTEGKVAENRKEFIEFLKDNDYKLPKDKELGGMSDSDLVEWINEDIGSCEFTKLYYISKRIFINVFFTEKSADDFIEKNNYHYTKEVHTYVDSLWRNPEMQYIREMILSGKLNEVVGEDK